MHRGVRFTSSSISSHLCQEPLGERQVGLLPGCSGCGRSQRALSQESDPRTRTQASGLEASSGFQVKTPGRKARRAAAQPVLKTAAVLVVQADRRGLWVLRPHPCNKPKAQRRKESQDRARKSPGLLCRRHLRVEPARHTKPKTRSPKGSPCQWKRLTERPSLCTYLLGKHTKV